MDTDARGKFSWDAANVVVTARPEPNATLEALRESKHATVVPAESQAWLLTGKAVDVARSVVGGTLTASAEKREGGFLDVDSDDSFLDLPVPRYQDGTTGATGEALDRQRDPAWRRAHGRGPLPDLPPPVDR